MIPAAAYSSGLNEQLVKFSRALLIPATTFLRLHGASCQAAAAVSSADWVDVTFDQQGVQHAVDSETEPNSAIPISKNSIHAPSLRKIKS
ncbi:hypothetical protein B0T19DRAFT_442067 [Cercophora scortea]|uniref:Uncharacterized protein n=1 Tax=Cercophora scortea TaxID=314031 RepID=A0AAE0IMZ6_9PEZI|nr:hypothetical protein B0T19DRAFT_442067 [Cercophora scortea]